MMFGVPLLKVFLMRVFRYGKIFKWLYPNRLWYKPSKDKVIYLTFDDGPVPEATLYVLKELGKVSAKATFFVVGDNVKKHPEVYEQVIESGHSVGNHTMNHVNGEYCRPIDYQSNVLTCESFIFKENVKKLFRPPYGKLTRSQEKLFSNYKIVMWSVLGYDFDKSLSREICLDKLINFTKPGSVVLLHDSMKTLDRLKYVLPRYLNHFHKLGYQFQAL